MIQMSQEYVKNKLNNEDGGVRTFEAEGTARCYCHMCLALLSCIGHLYILLKLCT